MQRFKKIYKQVIEEGKTSISFEDLRFLLNKIGFKERCKGDNFIFTLEGINEIINLQPDGKSAKKYQVKQVRQIVTKYKLGGNSDEE